MKRSLADGGGGGGGTAKGTVWEGGHRVAGIARWTNHLHHPGRTSPALAMTVDFIPTFLALAGGRLRNDRDYDGVDLSPVLLDGDDTKGHVTLFHAHSSAGTMVDNVPAMRLGRFKARPMPAAAPPAPVLPRPPPQSKIPY